jgi:hypothetical protein
MNTKYTTSLVALVAVLGPASFALAADTNSFDASVSVLSPDQTGFLIGGQVAVNGVGTGALTMTRSAATMTLTGAASSLLDPTSVVGVPIGNEAPGSTGPAFAQFGVLDGVTSTAKITSALDFDRQITTSGALVGLGSVIARGEAIGAMGSAGAASSKTTTAGTRTERLFGTGVTGSTNYTLAGGEGNATSDASAQGSLNGSLSTTNTLQLLGASSLFAGSNGTTIGEDSTALAYGSSDVLADGVTGVDLTTATATGTTATGNGGLFQLSSVLNNGSGTNVAMTVANAGNGSISITSSTGGFFTGGGAAAGSSSLADTNSFFGGAYTTSIQP